MGNCCKSYEERLNDRGQNPEPTHDRSCTDPHWCLIFVAFVAGLSFLGSRMFDAGQIDRITHGHDAYGNLCGVDQGVEDKPLVFYPDLMSDALVPGNDLLKKRYGLCVSGIGSDPNTPYPNSSFDMATLSCPNWGTNVSDYFGTCGNSTAGWPDPVGECSKRGHGYQWPVATKSFNFLGRCIPYQAPLINGGTTMCAYGRNVQQPDGSFRSQSVCNDVGPTGIPTVYSQVCGLQGDGTNKFWLTSAPDQSVITQWISEGRDPTTWIPAAMGIYASASPQDLASWSLRDQCDESFTRTANVYVMPTNSTVTQKVLSLLTSPLVQASAEVWNNAWLIVGVGLGGAIIMSIAIVGTFSYCTTLMLFVLTVFMFLVLLVADYLMFVQAGWATGNTGRAVLADIGKHVVVNVPPEVEDLLTNSGTSATTAQLFAVAAFGLATIIGLLVCGALAMISRIRVLVALLEEAANALRALPTLIVLPYAMIFILMCNMAWLMVAIIKVGTVMPDEPIPVFSQIIPNNHAAARYAAYITFTFAALWIYFFTVGLKTITIAITIARWYFRGDLEQRNICPSCRGLTGISVIHSLCEVLVYHLGSVAKGSFLLAVCSLPRIVLQFAERTMGDGVQQNEAHQAILKVVKCLLACLECCLKFITEYAYVFVAIDSESFCSAAGFSIQLFSKYPLQVPLNAAVSRVLGFLTCVTVPGFLGLLVFVIKGAQPSNPGAVVATNRSAVVATIMLLAFMTTKLSMGVYDVILTTLFGCVVRDEEYFGGKFMSPALRAACHLDSHGRAREIQMERSDRA